MSHLGDAAAQAWPPFVLVVGLLLIGRAAAADGLFEVLGARVERTPGPTAALLAVVLLAVAVTTTLLNLDTAVVFLTPVALHAARRRGADELPFLYGTVFMANAASLPLPGSNLTNLIVLAQLDASGAEYARAIEPAALVAILVTGLGVMALHRRRLGGGERTAAAAPVRLRGRLGPAAALLAVVPIVVLGNAALVVLAIGVGVTLVQVRSGIVRPGEAVRSVAPLVTAGLFAVAVALGTLARVWDGPARLLHDASPAFTTLVAALSSVVLNNLPSAVLLSSVPPPHPEALLIGLGLGPNLAMTGSLSALLWWRAARATSARPSALAFSRQGLVLAPLAMAAALLVS